MKGWQADKQRLGRKYKSTTHYILSALIPYTEVNLKLSFKPSLFFNDLEKLGQLKAVRKSLQSSYYKAIKNGLIVLDESGVPRLTDKGLRKTKPFTAKKMKQARLMIVFDIPESERRKRDRLRLLLRELSFKQIQKSVWMSEYDHREYIQAEIQDFGLEDYVQLFESQLIEIGS